MTRHRGRSESTEPECCQVAQIRCLLFCSKLCNSLAMVSNKTAAF